MSRLHVLHSQVVSELWKYIKAHNLQNPADKRHIILNSTMEEVFGVPELTMFTINKALTAHLTPTAVAEPSSEPAAAAGTGEADSAPSSADAGDAGAQGLAV